MIYWILQRVLYRGFRSRRGILPLGEMEHLARSSTAGLLMAQEKARLEFLAAKEDYEKSRSWRSFQFLLERLLQLQSTNAVIQALIQEHQLEQLQQQAPPIEQRIAARRSA